MKKRIALAVVSALAGGLLVAAPASATGTVTAGLPFAVKVADTGSDTTTTSATLSATQLAGASNFVQLEAETNTATGTHAVVTVTGSTIGARGGSDTGTLNAAATVLTYGSETITSSTFNVLTPAAGTITVLVQGVTNSANSAGQYTYTTLQTITITVGASAVTGLISASNSTAAMTAVVGSLSSDSMTVTTSKAVATNVANILVTLKDANGALVSSSATSSVSIAGPGSLNVGGSAGRALSVTGNTYTVAVYSDNTTGSGVITITAGAFTATRTVVFYGTATALTPAIANNYIGAADTTTVTVTAKDASGVAVPAGNLYAKSSDSTIATIASTGALSSTGAKFTVTGVAAGTATFTIGTDSSYSNPVTVVVNVTGKVVKSVSWSFDTSTYTPGAKAVLTISLADSNGKPVADGTYALFTAAPATSVQLNGDAIATAGNVTTTNGKATYTVYMPLTAGPIVVTAKTSTSAQLDSSIQGLAVSVGATVAVPVDAVAAAAAAAQAKQIAVLGTSISSLTTTVAALVASMTAQIKVINATLKTQSLVLAKIKKKLGIR